MNKSNGAITVITREQRQKRHQERKERKQFNKNKPRPERKQPQIRPQPPSQQPIPAKNVVLGINVDKDDTHREVLSRLEGKIKDNKEKVTEFKDKVGDLRDFNNKLADGYQLSLKMVVDVSDLLNHYVKIFEMLEGLMGNIDATFEFSDDDFQYIRSLTEKSVQDIRFRLGHQVNDMIKVFEDNGYGDKARELKRFKEHNVVIGKDADILSKTTKTATSTSLQPISTTPSPTPPVNTQGMGTINVVQKTQQQKTQLPNNSKKNNTVNKPSGSRFGRFMKSLIFGKPKGQTGAGTQSFKFTRNGYTRYIARSLK